MLVVIDGIDGAGKGTLTRHLLTQARADGVAAETLSFPRYDETAFGKLVGQYLDGRFGGLDEVPVRFAVLLYAGDRYESRQHLLELLDRNRLVVLDRYVSSNTAYNAAKLPIAEQAEMIAWIEELEYETFALPRPDLTCLLATAPQTAHELVTRKDQRSYTESVHDLHEADNDYMTKVAAVYQTLAAKDDESWLRIDPLDETGALRPPEAIADEVWREISDRL
jgi:dTMP kinase